MRLGRQPGPRGRRTALCCELGSASLSGLRLAAWLLRPLADDLPVKLRGVIGQQVWNPPADRNPLATYYPTMGGNCDFARSLQQIFAVSDRATGEPLSG
jgi:hypothetical protein